jgi:hypothetical protein
VAASPASRIDSSIASLDVGLFEAIGRPGWRGDAVSLLALHAASRDVYGTFGYLEIGSYLGSSLQSFIADPRCTSVVSIDPRPELLPDDRGYGVLYPENTTARMIACLERVPDADLPKLKTFECDASQVDLEALPERPHACFVDGEHTHAAALSDARFCRRAVDPGGVVFFHDRTVVAGAISEFLRELERDGARFFGYALPAAMFVIEFGRPRLFEHPAVAHRLAPGAAAVWRTANASTRKVAFLLDADARARRVAAVPLRPLVAAIRSRRTADGPKGPTALIVPFDPEHRNAAER